MYMHKRRGGPLAGLVLAGGLMVAAVSPFTSVQAQDKAGDGGLPGPLSGTVRLVVIATETSAGSLLEKRRQYTLTFPTASIIHSDNCSNLKPGLFLLVTHAGQSGAEAALGEARGQVKDAYARVCDVIPGSLLNLGIPVVHDSINQLSVDALNWGEEDRVSSLQAIEGLGYLLTESRYEPGDEGPSGERRQALYFFTHDARQRALVAAHCWDRSEPDHAANRIALHCAHANAADHLLHTSLVFDTKISKRVYEQSACRNPRLESARVMSCAREAVDAEGQLSLKRERFELP